MKQFNLSMPITIAATVLLAIILNNPSRRIRLREQRPTRTPTYYTGALGWIDENFGSWQENLSRNSGQPYRRISNKERPMMK